MNVFVGCEESGVVRRTFELNGHNAYSCDLLPARDKSIKHLECDVFEGLYFMVWDLVILHPPCTETCLSGNGTYAGTLDRFNRGLMVKKLWNDSKAVCNRVALEQPMTTLGSFIGNPSQRTNLNQFGHSETKSMWLWLYGLKPLLPTKIMTNFSAKVHFESPGTINGFTRAQRRSETRQGFADAMLQWVSE